MESGVRNNVDSVLAHPGFNATDRTNDIALIKLKTQLSWSSTIYPICLWTNTTHTPMKLDINYQTTYDEKSVVDYGKTYLLGKHIHSNIITALIFPALKTYVSTAKKLHPMYNSDCQLAHRTTLRSSQLCTRSPYHSAVCVAPADQLIWADKDRSSSVMYLVGMATRACGPPVKWKYNVFTRISAFAQWISENAFGV